MKPFKRKLITLKTGGWTLIELTIVISLISILAGISLVGYRTAIRHSKEAVLKENLFRMRTAIEQYYVDQAEYPHALDRLVSEGYLRKVPNDPFTHSTTTWQLISPDYDQNDLTKRGVFDVKSGSDDVAIDGTPYAGW